MNLTMHRNDDSRSEVDAVLHDYFQAQLPNPWPAFREPVTFTRKSTPASWSQSTGRFALAASIVAMVAGYLTLGGFFPQTQTQNGTVQVAPDTAQKEPKSQPSRTHTPTPAPESRTPENPMQPIGAETTPNRKR